MTAPPAEPASHAPRTGLLRAAAGLVVAGRFLTVTEATLLDPSPGGAAADLWLSVLALLAVCGWAAEAWGARRGGIRVGPCDLFLWALVSAHMAATAPVFLEGGDRRAAANTVFNWVGLAAGLFLLRQVWRPGDGRRLAALMAAVGAGAAAVGLWQATVSLPADRAAYRDLRDRAAALEERLAGRAARLGSTRRARAELNRVRAGLATFGVPDDPAARRRFEDRFLNSTEPFGPYSLANTLAGVLLAAAVVCTGLWRGGGGAKFAAGAAMLLIGVLVLTKSRTGWVGFAAGLAVWGCVTLAGGASRAAARRALIGGAVVIGALLAGVGGLSAAGVLDREVLSEAPRSLAFRLQYWTGTLRALAERPLLGTGPANFRPFYLLHKDAAASESIAAPHNLVLDLWASGGLLAPLFAAGLAWAGVRRWRAAAGVAKEKGDETTEPARWDPLFTGVLLSFAAVGGAGWATGAGGNVVIVAAAIPAAVVLWFCGGPPAADRGVGAAWAGAAAGLAVHLLGADGAEFPAVIQIFLLALAAAPPPSPVAGPPGGRARGPAAIGGAAAALATGGLWLIVLPAQTAGSLLTDAAADAAAGRDPAGALRRAAAADPLTDEPLARRAEWASGRFLADPSNRTWRRRSEKLWGEYAARRPRDGRPWAWLSRVRRAAGDRPGAVAADRAAAARDPSAAAPLADLAESLRAAGDLPAARRAAAAALARDDLTRGAGHADRALPAAVRAELERLAR